MSNYLEDIAGLVRAELLPEQLPAGPVEELLVSYATLALSLGEQTTNAAVHDVWSAWMMRQDPTHPSIVPFDRLSPEIAALDEPYARAIRDVATKLRST